MDIFVDVWMGNLAQNRSSIWSKNIMRGEGARYITREEGLIGKPSSQSGEAGKGFEKMVGEPRSMKNLG